MATTAWVKMGAIVRRDVRLRLSYPSELFTSVWGVLIGVFTFFFIGRLVGDNTLLRDVEGGYFAFALTGLIVVTLAFAAMVVVRSSFNSERTGGTLELVLSGATDLPTFLTGSMVVPLAFAGLQVVVYAVLGWILAPDALSPTTWLRALPVLLLLIGAFLAVGLWSAAFVLVAHRGDPFTGPFVQATNLIAGALFPIAILPEWLQTVARLIPTFYGFEALRALMLSDASFGSVIDELAILAAFDVVLAVIGVILLRRALRFSRTMGTLSTP